MYTVIGNLYTRTFRVLWALEEMGEAYEFHKAMPRSESVTKHSALGKVPVLLDGTDVLTDSMAIVTYLAAEAGSVARAQQDAMTFWLVDEMDALLWTSTKHSMILPEKLRVPSIKDTLRKEFARNMTYLGSQIRGEFLMGDSFTIPDILAVHCLNWAVSAKFEFENEAVDAYAKRVRAREAYKRVRALDSD